MRTGRFKDKYNLKALGVFFVLFLVCVVSVRSVWRVYQKYHGARETFGRMQNEIVTLENRKEELSEEISELYTNEGLSFELRKKLNVSLRDEQVAIIVQSENETVEPGGDDSWWEKFKNWFR